MNKKNFLWGVLILAAFLRFYQLPDRMTFTIDEEYAANFALTIIKDFHIILTGLTVSVGFYMGPLFIYLTAFFLWIARLNPELLSYVAAATGVATTYLLYKLGSHFFSWKVGILAALFYGSLPLMVFYDQRYWNDFPIPFLSVALLGTLLKARQDSRWWILFALLSGVVFHFHVSIVPLLFIGLFYFLKQIRTIPTKNIVLSVVIFFLLYSPLLAFDYVHNWDNLRLPIKLLSSNESSSVTGFNIPEHIQSFYSSVGRLWFLQVGTEINDENSWGCAADVVTNTTQTTPHWLISLGAIGLLLLLFINKKTWKNYSSRLLAVSIIVLSGMFLLFPGKPLEYYLLGVFPLILQASAVVISQLNNRLIYILCTFIVSYSVWVVINGQSHFGLGAQKQIIYQVMNTIGDQPFHLTSEGGCHQYQGWRYLFKVYGKTPTTSYTDMTFGWLYPDELQTTRPGLTVKINEIRLPNPGFAVEYLYDKK